MPSNEPVALSDLRPELARAVREVGPTMDGGEVWECRADDCHRIACLVVVVPWDSSWGHAVDPYCEDHFPAGAPRRITRGWPGPTTPTRGARLRRRLVERLSSASRRGSKSPSHVEVMRSEVLDVVSEAIRTGTDLGLAGRLLSSIEAYDGAKGGAS